MELSTYDNLQPTNDVTYMSFFFKVTRSELKTDQLINLLNLQHIGMAALPCMNTFNCRLECAGTHLPASPARSGAVQTEFLDDEHWWLANIKRNPGSAVVLVAVSFDLVRCCRISCLWFWF